ncbi:MAG: DUF1552 domain-containing protein [Acidobacteriota bacterium]
MLIRAVRLPVAAGLILSAGWSVLQASSQRDVAAAGSPAAVALPGATLTQSTLTQYCVPCHNERVRTAGLVLDRMDLAHVSDSVETWEKVVRRLRAGTNSCAYMNTVSWTGATTPQPMEINPRVVFERMFGRAGTPAQRRARMQGDRSILDSIAAETARLQRDLSAGDRGKLGDYLDDIREIERRIQRTEARNGRDVTSLEAPLGVPESFEEHVALMFDLLTVAYQTDLTRVFTFMLGRELSNRTYTQLDLSEPHHAISHHANEPGKVAAHTRINTYHVGLFAKFLGRLRAIPDGDGSLLDHSMIFYGGGMGEGNGHSPYPMSVIAVGNGTGRLQGNRHIVAGERVPMANFWLDVANKFDCPLDRLGESNGRVDL